MPPSENIRFSPGLKKICQIVNPSLTINSRALKLLNKVIVELNRRLVTDCQGKFSGKNGALEIVKAVVSQACQGEMKRLAEAEGNRCILLHNCGLLSYRERIKGLTEVKEKRRKTFGPEFSKGLANLTKTAFLGASLQAQGNKLLCKLLGVLCMAISDKARNFATQQIITKFEIKQAVENIIPGEMLTHALAEGSRMVLLLECEKIVFHSPRQRVPGKVAKPVRKRVLKSDPTPRRRKAEVARKVKRSVSRAKKKQVETVKKNPVAKSTRRRDSKPRKKSVSKTRKRQISKAEKRAVSRIKRRLVSEVKKKAVRKQAVSKRKQSRDPVKRKRTPVSKIVRRSRTPSSKRRRKISPAKKPIPVQKRKAVPRKRKTPLKIQRKKGISATPTRKPARKPTKIVRKSPKPSIRKIKGFSYKYLEQGIKIANEKFKQSLSPDARKMISSILMELFVRMTEEISRQKSSEIGAVNIRDVVIKTFPNNLQSLAVARISQVVTSI